MNSFFTRILTFGIFWSLAGCATPLHQRLGRLKPGMDKAEVLELAGNPKRTWREDNTDLWTFVYYIGDQHFEQDVRFKDGHVAELPESRKVTATSPRDAVTEDYENLVKEAQGSRKIKKP